MMKEYYSVNTRYLKDGWKYYSDKEFEVDRHNAKIWHYIVKPDGEEVIMNFSPYQYPSVQQIEQYIEELKKRE
jgi:hypothetical protein